MQAVARTESRISCSPKPNCWMNGGCRNGWSCSPTTQYTKCPATDLAVDASPDNNLFYVADDRFRLSERVKRLMKRTAHAEFPHSRTRHLVSNVRIRKQSATKSKSVRRSSPIAPRMA